MATYEEIGLSAAIADKLVNASKQPGLSKLATPEGCKAFVDAGGDISDVVQGIGDEREKDILEALLKLPADESGSQLMEDDATEPGESDKSDVSADSSEGDSTEALSNDQDSSESAEDEAQSSEGEDGPVSASDTTEETPAAVAVEPAPSMQVVIEVPIGEIRPGFEKRQASAGRINVGRRPKMAQLQLAQPEAEALLKIREGLLQNDQRLSNGEPVKSNADVIRWLLAHVVEAA